MPAAYFEHTTNADDAERSKPDPDIVKAALRKLALPPRSCVLVGDTPYDAQAAQRSARAFHRRALRRMERCRSATGARGVRGSG